MSLTPTRCLILACGNPLRGDDGVGPWLAQWAGERFRTEDAVRVLSRQQWTPDLAEEIARAESVLFVDCSQESSPGESAPGEFAPGEFAPGESAPGEFAPGEFAPGSIQVVSVEPADERTGLATHHLGAAELLALAQELYGSLPCLRLLLTVSAGSTAMGEAFSAAVNAALPEACRRIEDFCCIDRRSCATR